ncbi:MAG: Na/Pi cotransporter family protein, partial [Lachnospiraceae bacterium]|nr:Na/Pi cotransporter family protein [Lachnospiraceae bacterium]
EMERMEQVLQVTFETLEKENRGSAEWMRRLAQLEHDIDDMTLQFRKAHMDRIKQGICSEEACIVYSEMLTDFERIGDHALDIAQEMLEMDMIE